MEFQWNENKNQTNFEKHGLSFADAELIFASRTISFKDEILKAIEF